MPFEPKSASSGAIEVPLFDPFLALIRCPSGSVDPFEAALALAAELRPEASAGRVRDEVERLGLRLSRRIRHAGAQDDPLAAMLHAARLLHDEARYEGDSESPLDPANCDLELVVERRRGIPITLALLVVEVARRAGVPAYVAAYPSRVLVGVASAPRPHFFDPFRGTRLVLPEWCQGLVDERAGGRALRAELAGPAPGSRVVERLLTSWRNAWVRQQDHDAAIRLQGRLVDLRPRDEAPLTERARLKLDAGRIVEAVRDLERAVALCRHGEEAASVRRQLEELRRRVAGDATA